MNKLRTLLVSKPEDVITESGGRENARTLQANQNQISVRRQCLTCKNKCCVGRCRFPNPSAERTPVDGASAPFKKGDLYRICTVVRLSRRIGSPGPRILAGFFSPPNLTGGPNATPPGTSHAKDFSESLYAWLSTLG